MNVKCPLHYMTIYSYLNRQVTITRAKLEVTCNVNDPTKIIVVVVVETHIQVAICIVYSLVERSICAKASSHKNSVDIWYRKWCKQ